MPWRLDMGAGNTTANEYHKYPDSSLIPEEYLMEYLGKTSPEHEAHFRKFPLSFWQDEVLYLLVRSNKPFPKEIVPFPIKQITGKANFPDFFTCCGFIAVSSRFKELLEKFEPGVHRFEPVEFQDVEGVRRLNEMFILRIGNLIDDGILMEESDTEYQLHKGKIVAIHSTHTPPQIMWDANKIEGRHLWIDALARKLITGSDELYAEMKRLKMTGFQAQESRVK